MSMGASIVYGQESTDGNGFRLALQETLQANGTMQISMVGTQHSGNMTSNHHEAYTNTQIAALGEKARNSSSYDLKPDMILVLVGTNDCWYIANEPHPDDPAEPDSRVEDGEIIAGRFGELLTNISSESPDSLILASELPFNTNAWNDRCIRGFNEKLPDAVSNATSRGENVRLVSMYDAVPEGEMREDGTHPTDEGYRLMGVRWAEAVEKAVGEMCADATKTGSSSTASGTSTAAAGQTSQASGSGVGRVVFGWFEIWLSALVMVCAWLV